MVRLDATPVSELIDASASGDVQRVRSALASGISVDARDENGLTSLMHAAAGGHEDVARLLLSAKANPNYATEKGVTALMLAAGTGKVRVLAILLEHGARIDQTTDGGATALMVAALHAQKDCVGILLERGADRTLKAKNGNTALDMARSSKSVEVITMISPDDGAAHSLPETDALGVVTLLDTNEIPDPGINCTFQADGAGTTDPMRTDSRGQFRIVLKKGATYQISCDKFGRVVAFDQRLTLSRVAGPYIHQVNLRIIVETSYSSKIALENVYFDANRSDLLPPAFPALNKLVQALKANESMIVEIAGHTDATGTRERNIVLSRERADSVRAFLLRAGISAERVIAKGYGPVQPVADNATEEGRRKNRRTEVRVIRTGKGE